MAFWRKIVNHTLNQVFASIQSLIITEVFHLCSQSIAFQVNTYIQREVVMPTPSQTPHAACALHQDCQHARFTCLYTTQQTALHCTVSVFLLLSNDLFQEILNWDQRKVAYWYQEETLIQTLKANCILVMTDTCPEMHSFDCFSISQWI